MKNRLAGVMALVGVAFATQAQTITYEAPPGFPNIADSSGTALADGQTVEIGYFNSGFNISANANNLPLLGANWNLFDSTTITTITGPGQFAASRTMTASDASFSGNPVDLWIFKTSDGLAPASDFHNVLEYGLFSSGVANNAGANVTQWIFPALGAPPPNNNPIWTSADVKNSPVFYWGGINAGGTSLELAPVPEPSTAVLLGFGFVLASVLTRRIRR